MRAPLAIAVLLLTLSAPGAAALRAQQLGDDPPAPASSQPAPTPPITDATPASDGVPAAQEVPPPAPDQAPDQAPGPGAAPAPSDGAPPDAAPPADESEPVAAPAAPAPKAPRPADNTGVGIHRASLLLKARVKGASAKSCRVKDIVCDRAVGLVQFVTLDAGALIGRKDQMLSLPIDLLQFPPDTIHARLLVDDPGTIAGAPVFEKNQWPRDSDRPFVAKVWRHFNHQPYWDETPPAKQLHPDAHAFSMLRLGRLMGSTLLNEAGVKLGKIEDFAVDVRRGKVLYVIVSLENQSRPAAPSGGSWTSTASAPEPDLQRIAVPWWALDKDTTVPKLVLDMKYERLTKAPHFADNAWPDLSVSRWVTINAAFYEPSTVKLPAYKPLR